MKTVYFSLLLLLLARFWPIMVMGERAKGAGRRAGAKSRGNHCSVRDTVSYVQN